MAIELGPTYTLNSIISNDTFNPEYDIRVGFNFVSVPELQDFDQFAIGISFVDHVSWTGGGVGKSVGYAPSSDYTGYADVAGITGAKAQVVLDNTGVTMLSGNGIPVSSVVPVDGPVIYLRGSTFEALIAKPIRDYFGSFSGEHSVNIIITNCGRRILARYRTPETDLFTTFIDYTLPSPITGSIKCIITLSSPNSESGSVTHVKISKVSFAGKVE